MMPEHTDRGHTAQRAGPAGSAGDPPVEGATPIDSGGPRREGVLSVERHRKADGRLLILYRWTGEDG